MLKIKDTTRNSIVTAIAAALLVPVYGLLNKLPWLSLTIAVYFAVVVLFWFVLGLKSKKRLAFLLVVPLLLASMFNPMAFHLSALLLGSSLGISLLFLPENKGYRLFTFSFLFLAWYLCFGIYTFYSYTNKVDLPLPLVASPLSINPNPQPLIESEVRLIQLWHISCKPCRAQHIQLKRFSNSPWNEKISVELLNLDTKKAPLNAAKNYLINAKVNSHFTNQAAWIDSTFAPQGYPVLLLTNEEKTRYLFHGGYILTDEFYHLHTWLIKIMC